MGIYIGFILQLDGANIIVYDVDNSDFSVGCHETTKYKNNHSITSCKPKHTTYRTVRHHRGDTS